MMDHSEPPRVRSAATGFRLPTDRRASGRLKAGAALLVLSASYYVAQAIVAARWPATPGYSWSDNMISDLGVPECLGDLRQYGVASDRFICSPAHVLMNAEFITLGLLLLGAVLLLHPLLPKTRLGQAVPYLALINAIGVILVGSFPGSADEMPGGSQVRTALHPIGAYLELVSGVVIMIVVCYLFRAQRGYAAMTLVVIGVSVLGLIASLASSHLGFGAGGAERLAIDPFVCWRTITGVVLLIALFGTKPEPAVN